MSHLRAVPPKKDNYELAQSLERILEVVPMVESQRNDIKEAAERLKYQED